MKKINIFCKTIALIIALASVLSIFASCQKEPQNNEEEPKNLLDISGYTIVRYDNAKVKVTKKTTALKNAIKEKIGLDLAVTEDWYNPNTPPDPNAKEILIDKTNRKESQDALAKLESKEGDAFIVEITENKIVLAGKTDLSTIRAISYFINNYVLPSAQANTIDISGGSSEIRDYSAEKNIWITNKLDMDVEFTTTLISSSNKKTNALGYPTNITQVYFPSVIELQHQPKEENNGTLIAAVSIGEDPGISTIGCIMESRDGGKNWDVIARPEETVDTRLWAGQMAHIYELPAQVGNLPAGTLIYAANAVNYEYKSHIGVWRSFDCGKTWKEISIVASAGGLGEGVWEPVMFYEESDGYLYCFYSDDSDPDHDQKIVYKRSKNGVRWEKAVEVFASENPADRPGMPVITKMGNGEYFLVYEYCNSWMGDVQDCFIYYKTTKDITNWNSSDPGTRISAKVNGNDYTMASSPCCVWTPAGGENGTLFLQGRRQFGDLSIRTFVSFDYGKTWDTIETPIPYDWYSCVIDGVDQAIGYRPIMTLGADPSIIHFVTITDVKDIKKSQLQYAKLKVYYMYD